VADKHSSNGGPLSGVYPRPEEGTTKRCMLCGEILKDCFCALDVPTSPFMLPITQLRMGAFQRKP
jgi:hypothetical protein